ncbi:MAG: holB [Parachlamydiales bacterium]|nr:holB [Parachlamydiales bacterium]
MDFPATLLGNEPMKAYLSRAIASEQLHHTMLFSGRDGIGKFLFAKALARELLGASHERIERENHPDLHVLRPEGKSGTHWVDPLREMIQEVHKPPFEAKKKVFIICDAERMQPPAANTLLKTLEEPDLDCQFVLLTSSPNEILPTILSRCIHLFFQPLTRDQIAQFLMQRHSLDATRAAMLARLSNGSLGHAIRLLQDNRSEKAEQILFDALQEKISKVQAIEQIDALFSELEGLEFQRQAEHLIASYLMWARDQELKRAGGDEGLLYFPKSGPAMPLALIDAETRAATAQLAIERNIKLSACLDFLLLTKKKLVP